MDKDGELSVEMLEQVSQHFYNPSGSVIRQVVSQVDSDFFQLPQKSIRGKVTRDLEFGIDKRSDFNLKTLNFNMGVSSY